MKTMVFATATLLALAGCSGGHKDEAPLIENGTDANVVMGEENTVAPPPVAEPENATNVAAPAPPPAFSDEQQMRDDADASGLTQRLPDEETRPAEATNKMQ